MRRRVSESTGHEAGSRGSTVRRPSLGIDIGGTFTDLVLQGGDGRRHTHKILTTRHDPAEAVLAGAQAVCAQSGIAPRAIGRVVHATTLFTNALIERTGAVSGLITTRGFGDVLEIARERKYELYDLFQRKPSPLVPAGRRIEVDERLAPSGDVERPLHAAEVEAAIDRLVELGCEAVAVVYLHSFMNPAHEEETAAIARRRHPHLFVTASSEVSPVIREYERLSTTVANAYIGPLAGRYLERLRDGLGELGIEAPFFLMSSNGGVTDLDDARRTPVQLLESGPAAGALAGAHFGRREGLERLIAFDMGGTTAKLCIVDGGEPIITHELEAARERRFREGSGLPVSISTVELIEIGAGGGSIAALDQLGLLKVGPRSAGADPGPACYGRGGAEPTVTDADLIAGLLNPAYFLGGAMAIDLQAARTALAPLAQATGLDELGLAWGVHHVVNESMASAARVHAAERAYDPRQCALLATGGAGPLHAYDVARKLGIRTVVCPPSAGVGSALGLLIAPARADRSATLGERLDALDLADLERRFQLLEADARAAIERTGIDPEAAEHRRFADMRYAGQGFEITVRLPAGDLAARSADALRVAFEQTYEANFARTLPEARVEVVNLRVTLLAPVAEEAAPPPADEVAAEGVPSPKETRLVRFPEAQAALPTPVFARAALPVERRLEGPAIVEEAESTIVVGPSASFLRRRNDNVVITLEPFHPT